MAYSVLLCEGRGPSSPDLAFFTAVLIGLFSCEKLGGVKGKAWTKLRLKDREIWLQASGGVNDLLGIAREEFEKARQDGADRFAAAIDLDDKTAKDRENALLAALKNSGIAATMLGVQVKAAPFTVARHNVDEVIATIALRSEASLRNPVETCLKEVASAKQTPTWKLVTCVLAGLLDLEHAGPGVYYQVVNRWPETTKQVLTETGILDQLKALVS